MIGLSEDYSLTTPLWLTIPLFLAITGALLRPLANIE